jgi:hypothetical protein
VVNIEQRVAQQSIPVERSRSSWSDTPETAPVTNSEGSSSPQGVSLHRPRQSNVRVREVSAAPGPEQYRLLMVGGGSARRPEVLKEFGIKASDAPHAIRLASHVEWPPAAIGLVLIDGEGREVFGRDNPNRIPRR